MLNAILVSIVVTIFIVAGISYIAQNLTNWICRR